MKKIFLYLLLFSCLVSKSQQGINYAPVQKTGTLAANMVAYWNNAAGTLTGNTNFQFDGSTTLTYSTSTNVQMNSVLKNTSSGSSAAVLLQMNNSASHNANFFWGGGSYTGSIRYPQDGLGIESSGNNGMVLSCSSSSVTASIRFVCNSVGLTEYWRVDYLGNLSSTAANGTAILHLKAGSASASTGQIKANAGTLMTTAEANVFLENDGTNFYGTRNTTVGRWPYTFNSLQYTTPVTTNTVTSTAQIQRLVCNPAGTLAALTITFPANPVNGQFFGISISQIITALTLQTSDGSTINGTIVTAAANSFGSWVYNSTSTTWYKTD